MDAPMLFSGLSSLFAGALVCLIALGGNSRLKSVLRRARCSDNNPAERGGIVAWRLRNGFLTLLPLADVLLRNIRIQKLAVEGVQLCAEREYVTTQRAFITVIAAPIAALSLVGGLVSCSVVGVLALGICASAIVSVAIRTASDRRRDSVREAVPDVLRSMSACFEAGFTLQQTFAQVAGETKGPLRTRFLHAAHILETGGSASEALAQFKRGESTSDLAFVAVALDVQHQAGGSLKQVLDAARDAVEGELALRRSLKVQTAQARLSARVVSLMPFVLIAVFSLISNDFLAPFFSSAAGYALLAVALGMQAAGVGLVRRVLSVGATA